MFLFFVCFILFSFFFFNLLDYGFIVGPSKAFYYTVAEPAFYDDSPKEGRDGGRERAREGGREKGMEGGRERHRQRESL